MKFLFDFFPIIMFFVAYKIYGIYAATAVAIGASFLQVAWSWLKHRKVENMHLVTLGIIVVFGGATLALQDPTFIKWKPTVVNWLFAVAFLGSQFIGKKSFLQRMMDHAVNAPPPVWVRLNMAWVTFFTFVGALNLYVAYTYDEITWVNFKVFGLMGLTILFVILQSFYLYKYIEVDPETEPDTEKES